MNLTFFLLLQQTNNLLSIYVGILTEKLVTLWNSVFSHPKQQTGGVGWMESGDNVRFNLWWKDSTQSEREGIQDGTETSDDVWCGDNGFGQEDTKQIWR